MSSSNDSRANWQRPILAAAAAIVASAALACGCGGGSSSNGTCVVNPSPDTTAGALTEAPPPSFEAQQLPVAAIKTIATITFDDGRSDAFAAKDLLAPYGLKATFFVITGRVGESSYLTWQQLDELQAAGHEIGGHTVHHVDLTTVDGATATSEVCGSRQTLLQHGFPGLSFSYPFNGVNTGLEGIVQQCGYIAARTSAGLTLTAPPYANGIPPSNAFHLLAPVSFPTSATVEEIEQHVIDAENNGGGYVPLVFHHICDSGTSLAISPAKLKQLAAWLSQRSNQGTVVETMRQVMGR